MNQSGLAENSSAGLHEARRLKDLVEGIVQCCQERQLMEAQIFGLPQAALRCLLLFEDERYLTAKGIAARLEVGKSRVSAILDTLESKGLIDCTNDPNDGRVKLWSLSRAGRQKASEVEASLLSLHAKVLGQLEPNQRKGALAYLEILWSAMETVKQNWKEEQE